MSRLSHRIGYTVALLMHYRRLASLLVGAWLSGSFGMMVVATQNFRGVDRLLEAPSAQAAPLLRELGDDARPLLRYQVSELNRWYFQMWERTQLVLGIAVLGVLLFRAEGRPSMLILSSLMLASTAAVHWLITPEIIRLGRSIDFVPETVFSEARNRFWGLHTTYSIIETVKVGAGLALAAMLLRRRKRRAEKAEEEPDPPDPV